MTTARPHLFGPAVGARAGSRPPTPAERLRRQAGAPAGRVRSTLQQWLDELPTQAAEQIAERFASPREPVHLGALWELYVARGLRSLFGADVVEIDIGNDAVAGRRVPDFRVADEDGPVGPWRLEATAAAGADVLGDTKQRTLAEQLYLALDERLVSTDFLLHVALRAVGSGTPGRRVLNAVDSWLATLSWEELIAAKRAEGSGLPHARITEDGWTIDLKASARLPEHRGDPHFGNIAAKHEGPGPIDDAAPLRQALKSKAKHKYSLDDEPLIVGVVASGIDRDQEIAEALFGDMSHTLPTTADQEPTGSFAGHGLWQSASGAEINRDLSAVLVAPALTPYGLAAVQPSLWLNPWARRPVPVDLLPYRSWSVGPSGRLEERAASRSAAEVLGLPDGWPGG